MPSTQPVQKNNLEIVRPVLAGTALAITLVSAVFFTALLASMNQPGAFLGIGSLNAQAILSALQGPAVAGALLGVSVAGVVGSLVILCWRRKQPLTKEPLPPEDLKAVRPPSTEQPPLQRASPEQAAMSIQMAYRSLRAKRQLAQLKLEKTREQAARTIQKTWDRFLEKGYARKMRTISAIQDLDAREAALDGLHKELGKKWDQFSSPKNGLKPRSASQRDRLGAHAIRITGLQTLIYMDRRSKAAVSRELQELDEGIELVSKIEDRDRRAAGLHELDESLKQLAKKVDSSRELSESVLAYRREIHTKIMRVTKLQRDCYRQKSQVISGIKALAQEQEARESPVTELELKKAQSQQAAALTIQRAWTAFLHQRDRGKLLSISKMEKAADRYGATLQWAELLEEEQKSLLSERLFHNPRNTARRSILYDRLTLLHRCKTRCLDEKMREIVSPSRIEALAQEQEATESPVTELELKKAQSQQAAALTIQRAWTAFLHQRDRGKLLSISKMKKAADRHEAIRQWVQLLEKEYESLSSQRLFHNPRIADRRFTLHCRQTLLHHCQMRYFGEMMRGILSPPPPRVNRPRVVPAVFSASVEPPLPELPQEILLNIFGKLDARSLFRVGQAFSKAWRDVSQTEELWKELWTRLETFSCFQITPKDGEYRKRVLEKIRPHIDRTLPERLTVGEATVDRLRRFQWQAPESKLFFRSLDNSWNLRMVGESDRVGIVDARLAGGQAVVLLDHATAGDLEDCTFFSSTIIECLKRRDSTYYLQQVIFSAEQREWQLQEAVEIQGEVFPHLLLTPRGVALATSAKMGEETVLEFPSDNRAEMVTLPVQNIYAPTVQSRLSKLQGSLKYAYQCNAQTIEERSMLVKVNGIHNEVADLKKTREARTLSHLTFNGSHWQNFHYEFGTITFPTIWLNRGTTLFTRHPFDEIVEVYQLVKDTFQRTKRVSLDPKLLGQFPSPRFYLGQNSFAVFADRSAVDLHLLPSKSGEESQYRIEFDVNRGN